MEHGSLVVPLSPLSHMGVGPFRVLIAVAQIAGVGGFELRVAEGAGGSMEWSVRLMRAKEVIGM